MIVDNLSTHKIEAVRSFLLEHPNVHLHFTPTYSSWLDHLEWFATIERDLLARGVFTSVADLARKIRLSNPALQQDGETNPLELSQSNAPN